MNRPKTTLLLVTFVLVTLPTTEIKAQDPSRYEDFVQRTLHAAEQKHPEAPVIFAGSLGLDNWTEWLPPGEILDHEFEGSHTTDLIYFANELMLSHGPSKIFIYEGENDLANGKSVDIVLADLKTLFHVIRRRLPDTQIYLISPKPSLARLPIRHKYEELNYFLSRLCPEKDITFINFWDEMIDEYGDVKEDLFVEDGLHMNEDGYRLLAQAISPHLN